MGKIIDSITAAVKKAFTRETVAPPPKPKSETFILKSKRTKSKPVKKVKTRNPPLVKMAFYNKASYRLGMRSLKPGWAKRKPF